MLGKNKKLIDTSVETWYILNHPPLEDAKSQEKFFSKLKRKSLT